MASIGVLASVGYAVIGLPYALALGALAGLLEFVPMLGPTLGAIPAIIVALSVSPQAALLVVLYSIVIQVAENNILVPRMMGHSVGVSPVTVILAIFAFTNLLGFAGALLAIPLAAIVQVLTEHLVVQANLGGTAVPLNESSGVMSTMQTRIQQLRREVQHRLRTRQGYVTLSEGGVDAVDNQVDHILQTAEVVLTEAAQTVDNTSEEAHTALIAQVDEAISQADELLEGARDAETGLTGTPAAAEILPQPPAEPVGPVGRPAPGPVNSASGAG
jgi:hypothetical protein